jgi:hypothetical protein
MNKHEFKKGDLIKVNSSYVDYTNSFSDYTNSFSIDRIMRTLCGDVGIVLGTKFYKEQWQPTVSVYWVGFQRKVEMRTEFLEPINEKLRV